MTAPRAAALPKPDAPARRPGTPCPDGDPDPGVPRRPRLRASVPLLWRDADALQVGLDGPHAVVVHGVDAVHRRWLGGLDGILTATVQVARLVGARRPAEDAWALLRALARARALAEGPEPLGWLPPGERDRLAASEECAGLARGGTDGGERAMAARGRALVEIRGAHRLGAAVATTLAGAGVAHLRVIRAAGDAAVAGWADVAPLGPGTAGIGLVAPAAVRASVMALTPAVDLDPAGPAQVVVLAVAGPVPPDLGEPLVAAGAAHLVVALDGDRARVGPLVVPGRTACLRCEAEHRTDLDPAWPRLVAQLHGGRRPRPALDPGLAALAGTTAGLHVLAALDGGALDPHGEHALPPSAGAVLETDLTSLTWTRRAVRRHPRCWCGPGR